MRTILAGQLTSAQVAEVRGTATDLMFGTTTERIT